MSNEKAFAKVYEQHFDSIFGYLYWSTGDESLSTDISQTTFEKLWRQMSENGFRNQQATAWLYRVAKNLLLDHYKSHRHQKEKADGDSILSRLPAKDDLEKESLLNEMEEEFAQAINDLDVNTRTIIYLVDIEKKTIAHASRLLDFSESTARSLRKKGWLLLRARLEKKDFPDDFLQLMPALSVSKQGG